MRFIQVIALSLSIALMLVMSSMQLSMASHSLDHHQHSAQTHMTGVCAWMCGAAQTISTDNHTPSPTVSLLDPLQFTTVVSFSFSPQRFLPTRAPPFSSLSDPN